MKQITDNGFEVTKQELKSLKPSDFGNGKYVYVRKGEMQEIKYVIELDKGQYKTFALKTRVRDFKTNKYLDCTPGSQPGMRPYYIDNFISKN